MRELVYLSQRKLAQFDLGKGRRFVDRAKVEGQLTVPGLGGLKIGPPEGAGEILCPPSKT